MAPLMSYARMNRSRSGSASTSGWHTRVGTPTARAYSKAWRMDASVFLRDITPQLKGVIPASRVARGHGRQVARRSRAQPRAREENELRIGWPQSGRPDSRRTTMGRTAAKRDPKALIHEVFTREAAHLSLDEAVADFPAGEINTKPPNLSYSFWHILEHIRIGQWDLLEYVQNPEFMSHEWPEGYWRPADGTTDAGAWKRTIAAVKADPKRMHRVLADPGIDI